MSREFFRVSAAAVAGKSRDVLAEKLVRKLLAGPELVTDVVQAIKVLVGRGVRRLEALEVLVVMAAHPERPWSHAAICAGASYRSQTVTEGLTALEHARLVVRVGGAGDHYRVQDDVDRSQLRALVAAYRRDRLHVTNTFFACNLDTLRDLSADRKSRE